MVAVAMRMRWGDQRRQPVDELQRGEHQYGTAIRLRFGQVVHQPVHVDGFGKEEDREASFYSGVSVVANGPTTAQVAIGTNRVWIGEDWNPRATSKSKMHWKVLPSGDDLRLGDEEDTGTDTIDGGAIIALRWAGKDKLYVLARREVLVFARSTNWLKVVIHYQKKRSKFDNDDIAATGPMQVLPPF